MTIMRTADITESRGLTAPLSSKARSADTTATLDPTRCPLCGGSNHCQLCTPEAYKGPCWCVDVKFPEELLARVPVELRNKVCVCRKCVTQFHRENSLVKTPLKPMAGDFYFENGLVVFTAAYHLRRGYCCGSNCRHCPYLDDASSNKEAKVS